MTKSKNRMSKAVDVSSSNPLLVWLKELSTVADCSYRDGVNRRLVSTKLNEFAGFSQRYANSLRKTARVSSRPVREQFTKDTAYMLSLLMESIKLVEGYDLNPLFEETLLIQVNRLRKKCNLEVVSAIKTVNPNETTATESASTAVSIGSYVTNSKGIKYVLRYEVNEVRHYITSDYKVLNQSDSNYVDKTYKEASIPHHHKKAILSFNQIGKAIKASKYRITVRGFVCL